MKFQIINHINSYKKNIKKILIIFFLVLIVRIPTSSYFYLKSKFFSLDFLEIGQEASNFELKSTNGKSFNLTDYRGKKVLLVFFRTECSPCLKQLMNLKEIKEKSRPKLEVIAISESNMEKTLEFERTYNLNIPIFIDEEGVYKSKFKGTRLPAFYLLDEEMKVRYRRVGYRMVGLDTKIISEFERTNRIPIEILFADIQKKKSVIEEFNGFISALKAKEIALKNPEVRAVIKEKFTDIEQRDEIINLRWLNEEQKYRWIVQIIESPCNCPERQNTVNMIKIEIDPVSGQILNQKLIQELPEELFKAMLYQEVMDHSSSIHKEK